MAAPNDDELSGNWLGGARILEEVGGGGFGKVFRAFDALLQREVAVKVLNQRGAGFREAQLAARLRHAGAAQIHRVGIEEDGRVWIVMEFVSGIPLSRWLRQPMPLEQWAPLFAQIAEVVQAAHDQGIVHRDLKPSNIMAIEGKNGLSPKLLDFGLAKLLEQIDDSVDVATDRRGGAPVDADEPATPRAPLLAPLPRLGSLIAGTPPYISPEGWSRSRTVGPLSDLYALGVIAYEALTGRRPLGAELPVSIEHPALEEWSEAHCREPVPPVGEGLPPELDAFFERALAKRPGDRFSSAEEMAKALTAIAAAQPAARVRAGSQRWHQARQAPELLWRGAELAELERWMAGVDLALDRVGLAFCDACRADARAAADARQRQEQAAATAHRRRRSRLRRWLAAGVAAAGLAAIQYRGYLKTEMDGQLARESVTVAAKEQGRQAVLHGELAEARLHLGDAYRRGDHSPETTFMLERAIEPTLAELASLPATSGRMLSSRFSPGGARIVTADDRAAQVWDATTHKLLFTLQHGAAVYDALYSADGARLVTVTDRAVRVWDAATGAPIRELVQPRGDGAQPDYFRIALSPDGRVVVALDSQGAELHAWTVEGAALGRVQLTPAEFPLLAFSPDGRWLAATGGDGVEILNTSTWAIAASLSHGVRGLAFDPTGSQLVTGSADGDASIWSVPTGALLRHLRDVGESVDRVAWSPDGALVATASRDGAEQVWDAATGKLRSQGNHLHDKITCLEFDRGSTVVLAASAGGAVALADAASGLSLLSVESRRLVTAAHFDPTSRRIVVASHDGSARIWGAAPTYRRWSSPAPGGCDRDPTSLESDGRFLAIGCGDRTRIWDTAHDRLLADLPRAEPAGGDFASARPAVSAGGDRAAIARGRAVELYELPGGRLLRTITHGAAVSAVAFAPTGRDLVSGAIDGAVLLTHDERDPTPLTTSPSSIDAVALAADGRVIAADARGRAHVLGTTGVLAELELPGRARLLRVSTDGRALVAVARLTTVVPATLWDLAIYRRIAELGHDGYVYSARFWRDRILTAGGDGTARLWDRRTGRSLQTFTAPTSRFLADAALSPDGSLVVAGGADGFVRFWDASTARPIWALRVHASPVLGIHFDDADIVTRGAHGDVTRWRVSPSGAVLDACNRAGRCAIVRP